MDLLQLRVALGSVADPDRAAPMAAYLKEQFTFLGVGSVERRKAQRPYVGEWRTLEPGELDRVIRSLWNEPEREFQYVGADLLRKAAPRLPAESLGLVRWAIETKSWWDTVDSLAKVIGMLVLSHPELADEMDRWILAENMWVVRAAILHQLSWKDRGDPEVVMSYCEQQIGHSDFFIRKAIGWALRDLARTYPDEVWAWVDVHPDLSGLSRREATKHRPG